MLYPSDPSPYSARWPGLVTHWLSSLPWLSTALGIVSKALNWPTSYEAGMSSSLSLISCLSLSYSLLFWNNAFPSVPSAFTMPSLSFSLSLTFFLIIQMATHSIILVWEIPWIEEPGELQSTGSQRVGHDWATNTHTHRFIYFWLLWVLVAALSLSLVAEWRGGHSLSWCMGLSLRWWFLLLRSTGSRR